jgi:hypothetical protein
MIKVKGHDLSKWILNFVVKSNNSDEIVGRYVPTSELLDKLKTNKISCLSIRSKIPGIGKTWLALNVLFEYYEKTNRLIIPIVFEKEMESQEFFKKIDTFLGNVHPETDYQIEEHRKEILEDIKPLIFCDNYNLVEECKIEGSDTIHKFLRELPSGNTIFLTSSNEHPSAEFKFDNDESFPLCGINFKDGRDMFSTIVESRRPLKKDQLQEVERLMEVIEGHPLCIRQLARLYSGYPRKCKINLLTSSIREFSSKPQNSNSKIIEGCVENALTFFTAPILRLLLKLTIFDSPFPYKIATTIFEFSQDEFQALLKTGLIIRKDSCWGIPNNFKLYDFLYPCVREYIMLKNNLTDYTANSDRLFFCWPKVITSFLMMP